MIYARLFLLFALITCAPLAAKWKYYRSPNFELYADGSSGNAKDVLNHLEQVRDLFARMSDSDPESYKPVRVIAFNSEAGFKKLRRRGESAYAFYTQSRERNYIVFQELDADQMFEVAVHEYVHLRTREMGLSLPLWLSEGLAELYSTMRPQGSSVKVGYAPAIVRSRGVAGALPLKELLTASRGDAKLRKNANKMLGLYAKSWALTSMLTMHEDYREQFADLLLALAAGEEGADVLMEVYGKTVKDVQKDLGLHVRGVSLPIMVYDTAWDRQKHPLEPVVVSDVDAALMHGDLYRIMGKRDLARAEYESAAEIEPQNPLVLHGLGRLEPDEELRLDLYRRAADAGSEDPYLYLDYARALLRSEAPDLEAVRQALDSASQFGPELAAPHLALAALSEQAEDPAKTMLYLRRARNIAELGRYPQLLWTARTALSVDSKLQAGLALDQAAAHVRTEEQFREVSALRFELGKAAKPDPLAPVDQWIEEGELDLAAAELVRLEKIYPALVPIYDRFAEIQRRRGDLEKAAATEAAARRFRRVAVFVSGRDAAEVSPVISLLDATGFYSKSAEFFDAIVALDPDSWASFNNRAYTLAQNEVQPERAVALAERAVELQPDDNGVLDTLGWAYFKAGRIDDAIEVFSDILEEEDDTIYLFHYGVVLTEAGRTTEALEHFDRALKNKKLSSSFRKRVQEARDKAADENPG